MGKNNKRGHFVLWGRGLWRRAERAASETAAQAAGSPVPEATGSPVPTEAAGSPVPIEPAGRPAAEVVGRPAPEVAGSPAPEQVAASPALAVRSAADEVRLHSEDAACKRLEVMCTLNRRLYAGHADWVAGAALCCLTRRRTREAEADNWPPAADIRTTMNKVYEIDWDILLYQPGPEDATSFSRQAVQP